MVYVILGEGVAVGGGGERRVVRPPRAEDSKGQQKGRQNEYAQ